MIERRIENYYLYTQITSVAVFVLLRCKFRKAVRREKHGGQPLARLQAEFSAIVNMGKLGLRADPTRSPYTKITLLVKKRLYKPGQTSGKVNRIEAKVVVRENLVQNRVPQLRVQVGTLGTLVDSTLSKSWTCFIVDACPRVPIQPLRLVPTILPAPQSVSGREGNWKRNLYDLLKSPSRCIWQVARTSMPSGRVTLCDELLATCNQLVSIWRCATSCLALASTALNLALVGAGRRSPLSELAGRFPMLSLPNRTHSNVPILGYS